MEGDESPAGRRPQPARVFYKSVKLIKLIRSPKEPLIDFWYAYISVSQIPYLLSNGATWFDTLF